MPIDSHLSYFRKNLFRPFSIEKAPVAGLGMSVVIPCHDEPDVIPTLESLKSCLPTRQAVEVILVINAGIHQELAQKQNAKTEAEARQWIETNTSDALSFHLIVVNDLPKKHAGVGLARKIGMDEAAYRLEQAENPRGPIICFDADALCAENYLTAIEDWFETHPQSPGASIHFEHPLEGELPAEIYAGILRYELYLRYYIQGLRFAGYPYAFHTIGSSMVVRANVYCLQGGMNRRKAGEDFYFLHKIIPLGNFGEITNTKVIPSPRESHRVPFGTGKAMTAWMEGTQEAYPVYAFSSFPEWKKILDELRPPFFEKVQKGEWKLGTETIAKRYLKEIGFAEMVADAQKHSKNEQSFYKRLFTSLNGLKTLQFFHYLRDEKAQKQGVKEASKVLWEAISGESAPDSLSELLGIYRKADKKGFDPSETGFC